MTVCEAEDGQKLLPGRVYVSPGDKHLVLATDGKDHLCRLQSGPPINRHIPSVDVLFRSVAGVSGASAIGILLTGMGNDGALGLAAMRNEGAITIAQDKNSSVVWGMPREAINLGAANYILPLNKISGKLLSLHSNRDKRIQCQK
jgi:two-component system chemotaxis response regulator CheB